MRPADDGPVDATVDAVGGRLGGSFLGAECPRRENARLGCGTRQPGAGNDGSRYPRPVRMRLFIDIERVEATCDHAFELGMREVDAGVDDCDQHLLTLGELMGLPQAELGRRILPGIALAHRRQC
jgi:hypothetical protein